MTSDARDLGTRDERGFALVELLVVVLVLGVLAAVVVFAVGDTGTTRHDKNGSCVAEVLEVRLSIAAFKARNPTHANPADLAALARAGLLKTVPGASTPSGAAGYTYHASSGTYTGPPCPTG